MFAHTLTGVGAFTYITLRLHSIFRTTTDAQARAPPYSKIHGILTL